MRLQMLLVLFLLFKLSENKPVNIKDVSTTKEVRIRREVPQQDQPDVDTRRRSLKKKRKRRRRRRKREDMQTGNSQGDRGDGSSDNNSAHKMHLVYMAIPISGIFLLCFLALVLWHLKNSEKLCFKKSNRNKALRGQIINPIPRRKPGIVMENLHVNSGESSNISKSLNIVPTVNITKSIDISESDAVVASTDNPKDNNNKISTQITRTYSLDNLTCDVEPSSEKRKKPKLIHLKQIHKTTSLVNVSIHTKTSITVTRSCVDFGRKFDHDDEVTFSTSLVQMQDLKGEKKEEQLSLSSEACDVVDCSSKLELSKTPQLEEGKSTEK